MLRIETKNFVRITKQQARKRLADGKTVYICACNMNPDHPFGGAARIPENRDFQIFINEYRFYNCDYERGYYVNFYIEKSEENQK